MENSARGDVEPFEFVVADVEGLAPRIVCVGAGGMTSLATLRFCSKRGGAMEGGTLEAQQSETERNKAVVRRFIEEVQNKKNMDLFES